MAVRLPALRTGRALLPRNIIIFMFLVLLSVREAEDEKFIHLIASRTRDIPACSIVPQPLRYSVPRIGYMGDNM
jgi:hypothetical protein